MNDFFLEWIYFVLCLLMGILLSWFLHQFIRERFQTHRLKRIYIVLVFVVTREVISNIWHVEYDPVMSSLRQVVFFAITYISVWLFYQSDRNVRLFLCITYTAINEISLFFILELSQQVSHIFEFYLHLFEQGKIDADQVYYLSGVTQYGIQLGENGLHIWICWKILSLIVKKYRRKEYPLEKTEALFLCLPSFACWMVGLLLRAIVFSLNDGIPESLYEKVPILFLFVPAIFLILLFIILETILFFQEMIQLNEDKSMCMVLRQQVKGLQEYAKETERRNEEVRRWRHDMKNILSVAARLSGDSGNTEALSAYLSEAVREMETTEKSFATGNAIVDALLSMKYHELKNRCPDAVFETDGLLVPEDIRIQSYDIGIILGNALDNAIAACGKVTAVSAQERPFIRIFAFSKGKMFFLVIENSFCGKLKLIPGKEFPQTEKEDAGEHGLGLMNISRTADKYHGGVSWEVKNACFILTVMLQNNL